MFSYCEWSVPKNPSKLKYCNWKVIICYLTFKNDLIMTKNHDMGISFFCKSDRVCFESWIKVWYLCYWLTYGHKSMYIAWCILSLYVLSIYQSFYRGTRSFFNKPRVYSEAQHQECNTLLLEFECIFFKKNLQKKFSTIPDLGNIMGIYDWFCNGEDF